MDTQFIIAFFAGTLTTLSPCVLPVLPFILGSAGLKNKLGPLLICMGLLFSFVMIGWGLSALSFLFTADSQILKVISAVLLIILGLSLSVTIFSERFSNVLNPVANWANKKMSSLNEKNPFSSLALGALLGAVWSPCSGPTLGAAALLASQSDGRWLSLLIMLCFGVGAVIPLLVVAYGSRHFLKRHQGFILNNSAKLKTTMGLIMIFIGILILTGLDKNLEAYLTNALPDSWVDLITRY